MHKASLEITGQVAEVIEEKNIRQIRIVCNAKHLFITIDNNQEIHLRDEVQMKGYLNIKALTINGIQHITEK